MNPFQKNKVDMSALSPDEQKAFRMYGKLPNRKDVLQNKMKERKYFDSGDYALSKAGKSSEISPTDVGSEHPIPENIPHLATSPSQNAGIAHPGPSAGTAGSPTSSSTGGTPFPPPQNPSGNNSGSGAASMSQGGSPVKEGSFLSRETSIDEGGKEVHAASVKGGTSPPPSSDKKGVPVRSRGTTSS